MRHRRGWMALAALALVGGCAQPAPRQVGTVPARDGVAARPAGSVECSTTFLVLATVSKCGDGGMKFGVATE